MSIYLPAAQNKQANKQTPYFNKTFNFEISVLHVSSAHYWSHILLCGMQGTERTSDLFLHRSGRKLITYGYFLHQIRFLSKIPWTYFWSHLIRKTKCLHSRLERTLSCVLWWSIGFLDQYLSYLDKTVKQNRRNKLKLKANHYNFFLSNETALYLIKI